MTSDPRATQPAPEHRRSASAIDPHGYLRSGMRVLGEQGKAIGKVDVVERDAADQLIALQVQHGLIRRKRTRVVAQQVKQVNQDSVVLSITRDRFRKLPPIT
jgi:hypothetical protein